MEAQRCFSHVAARLAIHRSSSKSQATFEFILHVELAWKQALTGMGPSKLHADAGVS